MKNINHPIIGSLNINSIRYKFDQLKFLVQDHNDILILQETKIDQSFPSSKFLIDGYNPPFRRDRNSMGGGILVYIKENIPAKVLKITESIEGIFIEMRFKNDKWLLFCTYNPNGQNSKQFFIELERELDIYLCTYDRFIIDRGLQSGRDGLSSA